MKSNSNEYWAAKPSDEISDYINKKWREYQLYLGSTKQSDRIRKLYQLYYAMNQFGLQRDGSLSRINVNLFANIVDHLAILVSQNKLAYECAASNTDSESLAQTRLAREYLEFLGTEKSMDANLSQALLYGIMLTEAWVLADWSKSQGLGLSADPETGEVISSGQQNFNILTPFDVARDTKNPNVLQWVIVRKVVNKYDLAAEYPKHAEEILASKRQFKDEELNNFSSMTNSVDDENTELFLFYHEPTPALPSGRQTIVCGGVVLEDSKLKYESIPCVRFTPSDILGTVSGNSVSASLVGIQTAFDKILTAVTSNQMNLSMTSVFSNSPINIQRLAEGFQVLSNPTGQPPIPVNLGQSNPESYSYINLLQTLADKISGVPEIARGVAPQGVTAASAMSLMLSQAIAFASPIQRRYAAFAGDVASICVNNMKRFCQEEVLISIAGKSSKGAIRKVKGDSFSKIDRVICTISNPVSQTQQGREAIAKELLASGQVDGRRYVEILNGAPVEALFEDVADELSLINSENEVLREGGSAPVLKSDNHQEHRKRHLALLNSPMLRADPRLVAAVLDHVDEHDQQEAMRNQPPMPQPGAGAPAGPAPEETDQPMPDRLAGVAPAGLPQGAPEEAQLALDQAEYPQ